VKIRALAPGKVNLCLFVGGTRSDGRHELVTVFESVSLADELVLETLPGGSDEVVSPGVQGPNLVEDVLSGLRARGWSAPPVRVEVDKRVPVAAGMGGGSADAAATLRMAQLVDHVSAEAVEELAASLGADVPSQLEPGVALGTAAGDVVESRPALAPHAFVLVPLPYELSTAAVYAEADRLGLPRDPADLQARVDELRAALEPGARLADPLLVNDLEPAAVSLRDEISDALDAVREAGVDRVFVCGSGPTVCGLCWGEDGSERADAAASGLADRFPRATAVLPVDSDFGTPLFA
jgi:4-diphosphocytidyl-2-C-methyl-D-erythritol kinase